MPKRTLILIATLIMSAAIDPLHATEPTEVLLWPKGAPGAVGNETADKPLVTVFQPPAVKANGTAIVVCPGGGYGFLAVGHEGRDVAKWLNSIGVTAFVLQYRIAPRYRHVNGGVKVRRSAGWWRPNCEAHNCALR
jgi:acetyl esterase/lipase